MRTEYHRQPVRWPCFEVGCKRCYLAPLCVVSLASECCLRRLVCSGHDRVMMGKAILAEKPLMDKRSDLSLCKIDTLPASCHHHLLPIHEEVSRYLRYVLVWPRYVQLVQYHNRRYYKVVKYLQCCNHLHRELAPRDLANCMRMLRTHCLTLAC